MKHECELKFRLEGNEVKLLEEVLFENGFILKSSVVEHDFVPDTKGYDMRKNLMLARFRIRKYIDQKKRDEIIFTIKIKGGSKKFQDYQELEFLCNQSNINGNEITKCFEIMKQIGVGLDQDILTLDTIDEVNDYAEKVGLVNTRIRLEKKRRYFSKDDLIATIDTLPEDMGTFLELEAPSENRLNEFVNMLKLDNEEPITIDYGDLLKDILGKRIAVFG